MRYPLRNPAAPPAVVLALCMSLILVSQPAFLFAQISLTDLRRSFENPPDDAKPMMRWWWFGIAVEKPEIRRELEQMKADGIGGAELAFVYPLTIDDPEKGLTDETFLSPAMLDNVHYAVTEAHRLGLRLDVTLGSGWPYGGPATSVKEAAQHLRVVQFLLAPGATQLPAVALAPGETLLFISLVTGDPDHWQAATPQAFDTHPGTATALPPSNVNRTALIFIASPTGQVVKRAAMGAEGWVLDPFSHAAVATHLAAVGDPLVKAFGATPPYSVFSDSLEAYGADWTPDLPSEFRKRRGYDLLPHLPELIAGNSQEAANIRHDWGKTLTELIDENYLTQINDWANAHHTLFRSQTYGEPAVNFSSQRLVSLAEGEGPHWRTFSTLRWATSANHILGRKVTSAEAFTWLHSPVFAATPLDMKAEVDLHFLIGVNQIIGHGWPYSPPQAGEPGWSLYAAAVFNDHNPWHPVMPDVALYIQRMSYLLRQGQPANQVAILLPTDDAWASFSPGKVSVTEAMNDLVPPNLVSAILDGGYNYDFIDAETIDRVGIQPPILVLPPTERIPLSTLKRIQQYVARGGHVICVGRAPEKDAEGLAAPELTALSHHLFDAANSTLLPNASALSTALARVLPPDLQLSAEKAAIGFVRRKLPNADLYFVANTINRPVSVLATFATSHPSCERWNPDTGLALHCPSPARTHLDLAPYESAVFVFTEDHDQNLSQSPTMTQSSIPLADLSLDWQVTFVSMARSFSEHTRTDWTADPATRFYSGEAVYRRDFSLDRIASGSTSLEVEGGAPLQPVVRPINKDTPPSAIRAPGMRAWYDPPIHSAAIVFLNGKRAGSLWHPPYRLDLTSLLKQGQNHLEIHVYNTAINAWAAQPPHDFHSLIAKFGDRFQMQDMDKVQPLPSGLLGKIRLVNQPAP